MRFKVWRYEPAMIWPTTLSPYRTWAMSKPRSRSSQLPTLQSLGIYPPFMRTIAKGTAMRAKWALLFEAPCFAIGDSIPGEPTITTEIFMCNVLKGLMTVLVLDYNVLSLSQDMPARTAQAVADVSYRRGSLLWVIDGRANPLMDRKVVGGSAV